MIKAKIGQKAPLFSVSDWVQGEQTNFDQLTGKVVLLEVFQVNCPGCFLYALPQVIYLHNRYGNSGLAVIGIATAFEDFDLNTPDNLRKLIYHGEVIGETLNLLNQHGILKEGRLPYRIPFPVAMDTLIKRENTLSQDEVITFINEHIPAFDQRPEVHREKIIQQVRTHLEKLDYHAQTFEQFKLKGTPSHILVDKKGILRESAFGELPNLEQQIQGLLQE